MGPSPWQAHKRSDTGQSSTIPTTWQAVRRYMQPAKGQISKIKTFRNKLAQNKESTFWQNLSVHPEWTFSGQFTSCCICFNQDVKSYMRCIIWGAANTMGCLSSVHQIDIPSHSSIISCCSWWHRPVLPASHSIWFLGLWAKFESAHSWQSRLLIGVRDYYRDLKSKP